MTYARAWQFAQIGRYADAERAAREGLAAAPFDGGLLVLLASVLRLRKEYASALSTVDAAVAAAPHRADAHAERAELLILLLRAREAVEAAGEAVRLAPMEPAGHRVLARALAAAGSPAPARAAAAHGLSLDPRSVEGLLTVAEIERDAGNREAATAAARAALAIEPGSSYGRWLMAMLDAERLQVRRSMRGLREVARDNPARPDLSSMTWPIRGVLSGLRRGLVVGAGAVGLSLLVGHWWDPAATFARLLSAVVAAVLIGFAVRVLVPAGRLPWRCLPLLPAPMRRSGLAGLALVAVAVVVLVVQAATGGWVPVVLVLALWALGARATFMTRA